MDLISLNNTSGGYEDEQRLKDYEKIYDRFSRKKGLATRYVGRVDHILGGSNIARIVEFLTNRRYRTAILSFETSRDNNLG